LTFDTFSFYFWRFWIQIMNFDVKFEFGHFKEQFLILTIFIVIFLLLTVIWGVIAKVLRIEIVGNLIPYKICFNDFCPKGPCKGVTGRKMRAIHSSASVTPCGVSKERSSVTWGVTSKVLRSKVVGNFISYKICFSNFCPKGPCKGVIDQKPYKMYFFTFDTLNYTFDTF